MNTNDRIGIGLDTSLLQAVDSFITQQLKRSKSTPPDRLAMEHDPRPREQFVLAVDIFTDTVPSYLIVPKEKRGFLAPIGHLIADQAATLSEATEQYRIPIEAGTKYYRDFFSLFLRDYRFAAVAIQWGWFQILDLDVYLGYTTRMGPSSDLAFVKPEMKEQFLLALENLEHHERSRLLSDVTRLSTEKFKHGPADLKSFRHKLEESLAAPTQEVQKGDVRLGLDILTGVEAEIRGFRSTTRILGVSPDAALELFLLAYVGSVCRRGWQYAEVYTRRRDAARLVYEPHHMRGDYIRLSSITDGVAASVAARRTVCWSWGEQLAVAIEQRPSRWSRKRIADTLLDIKSRDIPISFDHNGQEELSGYLKSDQWYIARERLKETQIECRLCTGSASFHERFHELAPGFIRLVPALGLGAAMSIASGAASGLAAGAAVGATTTLLGKIPNSLLGERLTQLSHRTSEYLEEFWLNTTDAGRRRELSGGADDSDIPIGPVVTRVELHTESE